MKTEEEELKLKKLALEIKLLEAEMDSIQLEKAKKAITDNNNQEKYLAELKKLKKEGSFWNVNVNTFISIITVIVSTLSLWFTSVNNEEARKLELKKEYRNLITKTNLLDTALTQLFRDPNSLNYSSQLVILSNFDLLYPIMINEIVQNSSLHSLKVELKTCFFNNVEELFYNHYSSLDEIEKTNFKKKIEIIFSKMSQKSDKVYGDLNDSLHSRIKTIIKM